jgi:hypothetical protein
VNHEAVERLAGVHEFGMEPDVIAQRTLDAMRENRLHIFSHPDHKEEMREIFDEIIAEYRDYPKDPATTSASRSRHSAAILRQGPRRLARVGFLKASRFAEGPGSSPGRRFTTSVAPAPSRGPTQPRPHRNARTGHAKISAGVSISFFTA